MQPHVLAAALCCAAFSCSALARQALRPGLRQVRMRTAGDPEFECSRAELRLQPLARRAR